MKSILNDKQKSDSAAELLKAVAHPIRLRIISLLAINEFCVNDISQILNVQQAIVSQQLKILRLKRIVAIRKESGRVYYRLAIKRMKNLINCINKCEIDKEKK